MKTRNPADKMNVRRQRSAGWASVATVLLGLAICLGWAAVQAAAQTGGDGAIEGTVTDATGAMVPGANVTATNVGTGVATSRLASAAGYYNISPLQPGAYTVVVTGVGNTTGVALVEVYDVL